MSSNDQVNKASAGRSIKTKAVVRVAGNQYVDVFMDEIEFSNGVAGTHLRVSEPRSGAVVMVEDMNQHFYLQSVFRYAANEVLLGFVRGYADLRERIDETVLRELKEEATFTFKVMDPPRCIGFVRPNTTILTSRIPVFHVKVRVFSDETAAMDQEERPEGGLWLNTSELLGAVADGRIEDGFTQAAVALAMAHGIIRLDSQS